MVLNVFDWARERGGRVSDSIAVGMTSYGGKGMFAVRDIPAKEELIYLPSHLQLGVGQRATIQNSRTSRALSHGMI